MPLRGVCETVLPPLFPREGDRGGEFESREKKLRPIAISRPLRDSEVVDHLRYIYLALTGLDILVETITPWRCPGLIYRAPSGRVRKLCFPLSSQERGIEGVSSKAEKKS